MIWLTALIILLVALVVDGYWRAYTAHSDYLQLMGDYVKLAREHKKLQQEHLKVLRGRAADILRGELKKVN
jgi:hypothetical protein